MFSDALRRDAARIGAHLDEVLAKEPDLPVIHRMRYAVSGGKRLRGFLVMEGARLHGVPEAQAIWPAAAIEAIHAYSLVHDDLPCMDDDDLRRGLPTVHRKWDDGTAVLVGDALQTLGFELVLDAACHADPVVRADLALSLARASGHRGMVLGQALDIQAETAETPLTLDQITELQAGKTGALIVWSAQAGARLAQADLKPLTDYATALGLAFQIRDDILDATGSDADIGKPAGSDEARGKATYVTVLGLKEARVRLEAQQSLAKEIASRLGPPGTNLQSLTDFVATRNH